MQTTMKAIVATGYGSPAVFRFQDVSLPAVKDEEVLVKVVASTVTQADAMMRTGKPYIGRLFIGLNKPKYPIPGTGFAGVIESVGPNVKSLRVGDAVFGETTTNFSTNAEYVTVPESGVILRKPQSLDFAEAATLTDGHLTSYNFLKEIAGVTPGTRVLINGASGSLGTAAVQIAKYLGAEVTAVCSGRNAGLVRSLGADKVIDYTRQEFSELEDQFDVIYDTVGKSKFSKARRVLASEGLYLSPVMKLPLLLQMMWTSVFSKKKARFAATGLSNDEDLRRMLGEVLNIMREGHLKTVIDRQYPLEKVAEAHNYVDAGHKKGNVVINVQS